VRKRWRVLLILIVVLAIFLIWQFSPPPVYPPLPNDYASQRALWLDITWVMDNHSDGEIDALAQSLQAQSIDYVFAYVSYLNADDVFNPTFDYAAHFTTRFHEIAPEIKLLAWVGVPINVNGDNRLNNVSVRAIIADFAAETINQMGFDGFHLNAEPIANDDAAFIETLQEVRAALPEGAILSTTAHALRLNSFVTFTLYPTLAHHWTPDYLQLVAQNADQIVLMAYDSGLIFATDYRAWMNYQVKTSADALSDIEVDFLIGVPTSEEWTASHQLTAEYLANALYGVRAGLTQAVFPSAIDGIAIYPSWETDDNEWDLINEAFPK
jgi:hypothetical protein